ncbi:MAG: flippase [DPANN group archaeon]|nr:flippase [DPANN group archaeon]
MTNLTKKAVWGTVIVLVMGLFSSFLAYLLRLLLARQLTPAEYGLVYAIIAFFGMFALFQYMGLGEASVKYIAEFLAKKQFRKVKQVILTIMVSWFSTSALIGLVLILLSGWIASSYFDNPDVQGLVVLNAIILIFSPFEIIFKVLFRGFQRLVYYSLLSFVKMLVVLAITAVMLTLGFGVASPFWAYLLVFPFLLVLFGWLFLGKTFPSFFSLQAGFNRPITKKLFLFGVSAFLANMAGTVFTYTDTIVITIFRSLEEVGYYNVGLPTARVLWLIGTALIAVIFPMVSELWARKRISTLSTGLEQLYRFASIIILPVSFVMALFPRLILKLLFGAQYGPAAGVLRIVAAGTIIISFALINNSVLSGIGKPQIVSKIMLFSAGFNLAANLLLVPSMGIDGAALSTVASFLLVFIFSLLAVRKHIPFRLQPRLYLRIILSSLIFVVIVSMLKGVWSINPWSEAILSVVVAGIVYIGLLFLWRILSFAELKALWKQLLP